MNGKKTLYKKKPYRKVFRKTNFKSLVNKEISKRLNKTLETKHIDSIIAYNQTGANIYCLTASLQGLGDSLSRIGDQIKLKSFQMRGSILNADSYNTCRITLIRVNQNYSSIGAPTADQIYADVTTNPRYFNSPFHADNLRAGLFTVMFDKRITTDTDDPITHFSKYMKLRHRVDYIAGGNTAKGHLFLYVWGDSSLTPNPNIDMMVRVSYYDA